MTAAFLGRRVTIKDVLVSWTVSYFGNLAGSLFFMAIITGYGGVFDETPVYKEAAIRLGIQKCLEPQWHQIFLRGIGANWLVCMAVWMATQGRDVASKIIAIWWPTAVFVALALDHVVANMYFIPQAIFSGAPFGVGYYIWKSMIPTALGNMVGGGLFVGAAYWYLYLSGEAGVAISFDIGSIDTAVEGGAGPLRISGRDPKELKDVNGVDGQGTNGTSPLSGGRQVMSNYSYEMHDGSPCKSRSSTRSEGYPLTDFADAKTHKERMEEKAMSEKSQSPDSGV